MRKKEKSRGETYSDPVYKFLAKNKKQNEKKKKKQS